MKKYIVLGGSAFVNIVTAWSHYDDTKNLKEAIYKTMPVLIACLILMIISQYLDLKALRKEKESLVKNHEEQIRNYKTKVDDLTKRNTNLTKQFNKKKNDFSKMKEYWSFLNQSYLTALASTKNDRFNKAYNQYLTYTAHLDTFEEE